MSIFLSRLVLLVCFLVGTLAWSLYYYWNLMKAHWTRAVPLGLALSWKATTVSGQFNNPPSVPIWCGKAYMSTNASFNPGGWLYAPGPSSSPLVDLQFYPRMNLYLAGESSASLIIDAPLSYEVGQPFCSPEGYISDASGGSSYSHFDIIKSSTGEILVTDASVPVNSTGNEFKFSLSSFDASFDPYDILIKTTSSPCDFNIHAVTQLTVLPPRNDTGSVVKVDYLYGGLYTSYASSNSSTSWTLIFPYSYYVSWGGYLNGSLANLTSFASYGYNVIHPTPGGSQTEPFDEPEFTQFLDALDEMGLWLMYDMRWTYKNLTAVSSQVESLKSRKSLLLWYTADEPDGWGDPLNATSLAYSTIKSIDPYRPVSLVLNCYNFYFKEYTSGTDIILSDPYPIATNLTFSDEWDTPCNTTYGDCGCDDCVPPPFPNIPTRFDNFRNYQTWTGNPGYRGPSPLWGVPQAFGGSEYWTRPPTGAEEVVMDALFVNHGAKGLVAWDWPTTAELADATSALGKVLTGDEVTSFLLGAQPVGLDVESGGDVDAAGWRVGGKMLVSVVYMSYDDYTGSVSVSLPGAVGDIQMLWPMGSNGSVWTGSRNRLEKSGLAALEVSLVLVELD